MDPLSIAAQRFHTQMRLAWEPLHGEPRPALLRVLAKPAYRTQMLKALRLAEWQPDNRCPYIIVEDASTIDAIRRQIVGDYNALRRGLCDDGLDTPELHAGDLHSVLQQIAVAAADSQAIEGFVLALVPCPNHRLENHQLSQLASYIEEERLAIRLLAWDAGNEFGAQWPASAAFAVVELWDHLNGLTDVQPDDEPRVRELASSKPQRSAIEQRLGKRESSRSAATVLNRLLLAAGRQHQEGNPEAAAKQLRSARILCRMEGLATQQAACALAIGASICGVDERGAMTAFDEARTLAESQGQHAIVAQALFGTAAVHLQSSRTEEAARAYAAAGRVSQDASLAPLRKEAQRMRTLCLQEQ